MISPRVLAVLVENQTRFLEFLTPRLGSREAARELLQASMLKAVEKGGAIEEEESAVAWFYRLLRNAVTDHYRRRDAERRALEAKALDAPPAGEPDPGLHEAVCMCLHELLPTLKPEYADAIRRVDLEGAGIAEVAETRGITPNNARVLLHRARSALRKQLQLSCGTCTEHGCLDCSCGAQRRA